MHPNLNLEDHIRRTRDHFVYVRLRAPEFPAELRTSLAEQFALLQNGVNQMISRIRNPNRRRWLEIVLKDLQQALVAYESGDRNLGIDRMYSAEEHFKNAIHGKKHDQGSIASSDAEVEDPPEEFFQEEIRFEAQQAKESEKRFDQWHKKHPESPWHGAMAQLEPKPPSLLSRCFGWLASRPKK